MLYRVHAIASAVYNEARRLYLGEDFRDVDIIQDFTVTARYFWRDRLTQPLIGR